MIFQLLSLLAMLMYSSNILSCTTLCIVITNGVNAELIHNDSGLLLGIRVSWSWLLNVSVDCFQSPVVELSLTSGHPANSTSVTSGSRNNSIDFFNLDCNQMYTPKVKATYDNFQSSDTGNTVFFGGSYFFFCRLIL